MVPAVQLIQWCVFTFLMNWLEQPIQRKSIAIAYLRL